MVAGLTKRGVGGDRSHTPDCGAASTTTTRRRCTSWTRTASSATTTSANDATKQSERAVQRLLSVERELVGVERLGALIGVLGFPP
jgi:hypothetical protein